MRANAGFARTLHLISWSLFCSIFLAISIPRIHLSFESLHPGEPFYSTDSYLEEFTGTRHVSAKILHALASLPRDKAIVLVIPDAGVRTAFIVQNVTYLSWPREVRCVVADHPQAAQELYAMAPATLAAIIFWDVAPFQGMPNGARLGRRQVIVPLHRNASPEA